jgi:ABC-type lipoprotein release transport system permease subunit
MPAASLVFEGDIQFVESEELPLHIVYTVIDPISGESLEFDGLQLVYGLNKDSLSTMSGLEPSHLVVPADVPFSVKVNCSVIIGSNPVFRSFVLDDAQKFLLKVGELITFDIRRFSAPYNLGVVENLHRIVESRIVEMETVGFYLAPEMKMTTAAIRRLGEARYLYEDGRYIESFDEAKRSYLTLKQTDAGLARSYGDAALSGYILITFIAFSSTAIAFLLLDRNMTQLIGSFSVYAVTLTALYLSYPGSQMIPPELFIGSAAISILSSLIVTTLLPRFLRGRGSDGQLPVRNILIPIFSIAKRNLKRRRLRFILTLSSITILVISFVALTSLSEGYGLIVTRISRDTRTTGVLLRASSYTEAELVFISRADLESGWLERQPESRAVSPKAENLPLPQKVTTLNDQPIFGIIGIDPDVESKIFNLDKILSDGELPKERGILISEALYKELGARIGDFLSLGDTQVKLQGVFNDAAIRSLRDLDGSTYMPLKLVNTSPDGEIPTFSVTPCESSEIIITELSTALTIPRVGFSRVNIAVEDGIDVNIFAERLALERGYKAWSSSVRGVFFARMGSYIEGKGLQLIVPWSIVVLNVVATMLNSMYERRREIHILSSVGLNPVQLSAIFIAEASILGLIAGGIGYLGGLGVYRVMTFLQLALDVHQKVSAIWSLGAIGIAMTAVLIGALASMKGSVVITPSLNRRWTMEERQSEYTKTWEIFIPVRLLPDEVEDFIEFVVHKLKNHEKDQIRRTSSIRISSEASGALKRIDFIYKAAQSMVGRFYAKNALLFEKLSEDEVKVKLKSNGDRVSVYATGTLVRMITMEWSTERNRHVASKGS